MTQQLIEALEDLISALGDDHARCEWCDNLDHFQYDTEPHHLECRIGKYEALIAEAKAVPAIVYAIDEEHVQLFWDEDCMEDRPDLHWYQLSDGMREKYREEVRAVIVDQDVSDTVREIVWNIASRHLGANTE